MHATLCRTTLVQLDTLDIRDTSEDYITAPMATVVPDYQPIDEEVVYTSFEEAISERMSALHSLRNLSDHQSITEPLDETVKPVMSGFASLSAPMVRLALHSNRHTSLLNNVMQCSIIYICLALILIMLGFDAMGLLVLHIH